MKSIKTALISVYHKDGIIEFANGLMNLGCTTIYASGGTCRHLRESGIGAIDIATVVGGGPILGHRVVTLSREVHAMLLARYVQPPLKPGESSDIDQLKALGLAPIDLVCVDLYPLEAEIAKSGSTMESVIEQTDIGGPTMLRSAAKGRRIVIGDHWDRDKVIEWMRIGQPDEESFVGNLCAKAEFIVAKYALASAKYLGKGEYDGMLGRKIADCKYGENAWQTPAALYSYENGELLSPEDFKLVEGTPAGYNTFGDRDRLLQTITHIAATYEVNDGAVPLIAVGVKHGNPCGAAVGYSSAAVLGKMVNGDYMAIFGGVIVTNFPIERDGAEVLSVQKYDAIIAPSFTLEARGVLKRKGDKCRFIENEDLREIGASSLDRSCRRRPVRNGFLKQPNYTFVLSLKDPGIQRYGPAISPKQGYDLILAWAVNATSNSNTITIVRDDMLIGNGVGQQDRVGAAELAVTRAIRSKHSLKGAVACSDSFFPFPDGPEYLVKEGIAAILTTSGSVKDKETIGVCEKAGVSLIMIPDAKARGFFGH